MNEFRSVLLAAMIASPSLASAQMVLDEKLLWRERLFETESSEERDRPLQFKVYGGYKYDSNVFRLSSNADTQATLGSDNKSDNMYVLGVGAKYQITPSRQKIILEGNVEQDWFQNFDNLNHTANSVRGEWDWRVGNDWNGKLGARHLRYLENFAYVQDNVKDMVNRDYFYGSANYQPVSYLRFTVDLDWDDAEHDAESRQSLNYKSDSAAFTVGWVSPAQNTVGLQFKTTDSRYPNQQNISGSLVDNGYQEDEYNLVANWRISGASVFRARVGRTERTFDQDASRNFSGPTWRFAYEWEPTGKTALELAVWRELSGFDDLTGKYSRTTGIGLFPAWSVLPKLVLQGKATYQQREYQGGSFSTTGERDDNERLFQVAAIWTPLRLTKLILALETGDRNSTDPLGDYEFQAVSLGFIRTF